MLNWLKRLPGNKTAKPPAADKLDFDRLPLLSARGLIELTGQYGRLAHIKRIVQIDDATWQMLYQEVIERFAGLVQLMPASQAHHHAVPGGLFVHTLEVLEYALTGRQQYKLPLFASEKQQEDERHLWTYAVFLAAILHDVGKRLTLCRLILDDGRELPPFSGDPATLAGRHYRIVFNDPKYHALHEQIGLAFAGHLLPPLAQDFILPRLHVMQQLMGHIHGNPDAADIIGKIVREADQKSTGESLQHIPARQFKGATLENIGERLMTRLRHLLADNRFAINTRNGNVYTTGDYYSGYTWILGKTLADTLRQSLIEDGQTDIPHDNNRIFDIFGRTRIRRTQRRRQSDALPQAYPARQKRHLHRAQIPHRAPAHHPTAALPRRPGRSGRTRRKRSRLHGCDKNRADSCGRRTKTGSSRRTTACACNRAGTAGHLQRYHLPVG